jgi:predicted nucleic acid-binding protein
MGDIGRDKAYLGVDTNVLVSFFDAQHPDHPETKRLESFPNTATYVFR